MVRNIRGIYGFLGTCWILLTIPPRNTVRNSDYSTGKALTLIPRNVSKKQCSR